CALPVCLITAGCAALVGDLADVAGAQRPRREVGRQHLRDTQNSLLSDEANTGANGRQHALRILHVLPRRERAALNLSRLLDTSAYALHLREEVLFGVTLCLHLLLTEDAPFAVVRSAKAHVQPFRD